MAVGVVQLQVFPTNVLLRLDKALAQHLFRVLSRHLLIRKTLQRDDGVEWRSFVVRLSYLLGMGVQVVGEYEMFGAEGIKRLDGLSLGI